MTNSTSLKFRSSPPPPPPSEDKRASSVIDLHARRLPAPMVEVKPAVDWIFSNPANPAQGRAKISTRVHFTSGREVIFDGRLGKKEARKRALEIVTQERLVRMTGAIQAACNWVDALANGPGAPRPIREAYRLLRAALES